MKRAILKYDPNRTKLAEYMGVSRAHLYQLLDIKRVQWDYLRRAGEFMGHDFREEFPDMPPSLPHVGDAKVPYGFIRIDECDRRVANCKEQMIELQAQIIELQKQLADCRSASQSGKTGPPSA